MAVEMCPVCGREKDDGVSSYAGDVCSFSSSGEDDQHYRLGYERAVEVLREAKAEIKWAHSLMRRIAQAEGRGFETEYVVIGGRTCGLKPGRARLARINAVLPAQHAKSTAP